MKSLRLLLAILILVVLGIVVVVTIPFEAVTRILGWIIYNLAELGSRLVK